MNLKKQPSANVTIGLSSSDTTEGTISPSSLTFTSVNWSSAQTVTVLGINDYEDDGDITLTIVTAAATSTDSSYNGMNASDVAITNIDNDTAGMTIIPTSGLSVTEIGGTATFSVVLTSQPVADVSLGLSSSDTTEGIVAPVSLTYTANNWNTPQVVTVTGVDDGNFVDGNIDFNIVTAAASSIDPKYNGLNASDVPVTSIDNDMSGIIIVASGLSVTENGWDSHFSCGVKQPTGC